MSLNEIEILVNSLTDGDTLLLRFLACFNDSRFLGIYLDRLAACGFENFREVANRLASSLSVLIPLQVVASFRMVLIVAGNENVVADDFAVSFENGSELPRPGDSNLFENIDPFSVAFGASHRLPSMGEDIILGQRFGQTEEEWTPSGHQRR